MGRLLLFAVAGLDIFGKSDILKITRVLPANEQFPYKVIKEVTAIFVRDGRLLLFAVTDLDNEADHTDHKNTKLEQFRVCNHKSLAPLSMCRRAKEAVSLRKTRWGAARLPFIGSTMFTIAQVFQNCKKKPPESGGFRVLLTNSAFSLTMDLLV